MRIRLATPDDIETLVAARLGYLASEGWWPDSAGAAEVVGHLRAYFADHLSRGDFLAALAEDDGKLAAAAFLVIGAKPPGPSFPNGLTGTVLNVFTQPECRRRGLATALLRLLVAEAVARRLSALDLLATGAGKSLYERLGFADIGYSPMRLRIVDDAAP